MYNELIISAHQTFLFFKLHRYTCDSGLTFYDTTTNKDSMCMLSNSTILSTNTTTGSWEPGEWSPVHDECKGKISPISNFHDLFWLNLRTFGSLFIHRNQLIVFFLSDCWVLPSPPPVQKWPLCSLKPGPYVFSGLNQTALILMKTSSCYFIYIPQFGHALLHQTLLEGSWTQWILTHGRLEPPSIMTVGRQ